MIWKNEANRSFFSIVIANLFPRKYFFYTLNQLQKIFFTIYLKRDYETGHFSYEKDIQKKVLLALSQLLKINSDKFQNIFDLIISLGQLRFRLNEIATLEMMEQELKNVSVKLTALLRYRTEEIQQQFQQAVEALEKIFEGPVATSMKEPQIIEVFIDTLKNLGNEFS